MVKLSGQIGMEKDGNIPEEPLAQMRLALKKNPEES